MDLSAALSDAGRDLEAARMRIDGLVADVERMATRDQVRASEAKWGTLLCGSRNKSNIGMRWP